jgi:hypothetical protein
MLFLNDPNHLHVSALLKLCGRVVPPGHVLAAARSPGGEYMQNDFLAAKLSERSRAAVLDRRQHKVGQRLAGFDFQHGILHGFGRAVPATSEQRGC